MEWESVVNMCVENTDMKFFINENYDHTRFEVHMKCRSFCPILPLWWFYNKEEAKTFL